MPSSRTEIFFVKDSPQGPATANRQPAPTANRHQTPTATNRQPPSFGHEADSDRMNVRFCWCYEGLFFPLKDSPALPKVNCGFVLLQRPAASAPMAQFLGFSDKMWALWVAV